MTAAFIGRCIDDIGVFRVKFDIGNTGILINLENKCPVDTAIRRFVQTTVTAWGPQGAFCSNVDHIAVARIDHDFANMLGLFQTHIGPVFSGIGAFINTITPADMTAADIFPGTHPDHVGVIGVNRHIANGVGGLVIKHRRPGDTGIDGFPHTAGSRGHVPGTFFVRMYCDVSNTPTHQSRADAAHFQTACSFGDGFLICGDCRLEVNG